MQKWIVPVVIVGVLIIVASIVGSSWVSYNNNDIKFRNLATAQQQENAVIYDKVWKILQQSAGVLDKYSGDFKDIYTNIMAGRYASDAKQSPMMKWIQESNPNFSSEMYKSLMDKIEAQRSEFAMVQKRLIDIKREDDNLLDQFPGCVFLSGRQKIKIDIITSTKTENTFKTGKEDDVDLFGKK